MTIKRRIAEAEAAAQDLQAQSWETSEAILSRLTKEELEALAGPPEPWEGMTTEEIEAVARGEAPGPEGAEGYEPPRWVRDRLREVATEDELCLSGWAEVAYSDGA